MANTIYRGYLGTCSTHGSQGIYQIALNGETRDIQILSTIQAANADYLAISQDQQFLYASMEVIYYQGAATSAASAYRIEADGHLTYLNTQPIGGQLNNFIFVDKGRKHVYSSSYMAGTVTVNPVNADGSLAPASHILQHPVRPGMHHPSVHSVYVTPDGRYLLATDVGLDAIFLYETASGDYHLLAEVPVPGRPRQAAFSADGRYIYVSTEAGGEVFVFAYLPEDPAVLRQIQRISTAPVGFSDRHIETAGIKRSPNGELLYVTNRNPKLNNLGGFSVDPATGLLTKIDSVEIHGVFPWDLEFTPDGKYVLVSLRFSDEVELFEVDYVNKRWISCNKIHIPSCTCIKFLN